MLSALIALGLLYVLALSCGIAVAAVYFFKKKERKSAQIAIISVEGVLIYSKISGSNFQKFLKQVKEVSSAGVKALILEVNSPGGSVMASQEMYLALQKLKEGGTKVVSLMEGIAASGGGIYRYGGG